MFSAFSWPLLREATAQDAVRQDAVRPSANEQGKIMVLMYHQIGKKESTWSRSRENFRNDLETLYREGYRPVSLLDYVQNRITTPAGYTPVVLTFDDGREDHFRVVLREGQPTVDPHSAVGILEDFHRKHPDFPLEATFFVFGKRPFGQRKWVTYKLNYLVAQGMDIGNHTTGHQNLALPEHADPEKIQRYIGRERDYLESALTQHPGYKIQMLALCHGQRPRDRSLRRYLAAGTFEGRPYKNLAVLSVGSGPAPAPGSPEFQPDYIPRIRASDTGIGRLGISGWLDYFRKYPDKRYVSDGKNQGTGEKATSP